jgi:hypothetical protein
MHLRLVRTRGGQPQPAPLACIPAALQPLLLLLEPQPSGLLQLNGKDKYVFISYVHILSLRLTLRFFKK